MASALAACRMTLHSDDGTSRFDPGTSWADGTTACIFFLHSWSHAAALPNNATGPRWSHGVGIGSEETDDGDGGHKRVKCLGRPWGYGGMASRTATAMDLWWDLRVRKRERRRQRAKA